MNKTNVELDCSALVYETLYPKKIPEKRCENCKYRKLLTSTYVRKPENDYVILDNIYVCSYYDDFYKQNPIFNTDTCEHWKEKEVE